VEVHLTRDSVNADDDCDAPHDREISVPERASAAAVVAAINDVGYVTGWGTWSLTLRLPRGVGQAMATPPDAVLALPGGRHAPVF
jgi:hypothetical protein